MPLPDIDDFDATYGGTKIDYSEPIDPLTDLPAAASNNARCSTAGLTHVSKRIFVIWENDGTNGTVLSFDSVVGNDSSNHPTISKVATGKWRFVFPANCFDALGVEHFWNFRYAKGDAFLFATPVKVQCQISAPNQVEIYLFDLSTAALDDISGVGLLVEIY